MAIEQKDIEIIADTLEAKFDEFKEANDKRLDAVNSEKAELAGQVETLSKQVLELEKLKTELDEQLAAQAPGANQIGTNKVKEEHKNAFDHWMRKGVEDGLADLETKALNLGTDADGGFAVPEELDRSILDMLRDTTPMRGVCAQMTVGNEGYKKLVNLHGANSGWVGETAARPATDSPQLAELAPFYGEIYANPEATQKSLDDMFFDAEAWLSSEVSLEFAEQENVAFTSGDGVNKPKGFLAYPTAAAGDKTRAFGTLEHMDSSAAGSIAADDIVHLIYKLKAGYRGGAVWMGGTDTLAGIMVLKDGADQYLWRPGLEIGESLTLRGYRFVENEDMPAVAGNAKALAFGNFQRGYQIVDRIGIRLLRDPFTNKPYVGFYTTKRVGGMLVDSQAIKLLNVA